jgi:AmmeMemoRadiSam system protein B
LSTLQLRRSYWANHVLYSKRIFLLGPSHHHYLSGCALSQCDVYETPLGDLKVDKATIAELHQKGSFDKMSLSVDEAEHSLEMHLPYIYKVLSRYTTSILSTTTSPNFKTL